MSKQFRIWINQNIIRQVSKKNGITGPVTLAHASNTEQIVYDFEKKICDLCCRHCGSITQRNSQIKYKNRVVRNYSNGSLWLHDTFREQRLWSLGRGLREG